MNDGINTIIVTGPPGGGKSTGINRIEGILKKSGFDTVHFNDKIFLGYEVKREAVGYSMNSEGEIITPKMIYHNPDSDLDNFQAEFSDGSLLNNAHINLFKKLSVWQRQFRLGRKKYALVELACGVRVFYLGENAEPIYHEPQDLTAWSIDSGVNEHAIWIEVQAPLKTRVERNEIRRLSDRSKGYIRPKEFKKLFPDIRFTQDDINTVGIDRHLVIDNGQLTKEEYLEYLEIAHHAFIYPNLFPDGRWNGRERAHLLRKEY